MSQAVCLVAGDRGEIGSICNVEVERAVPIIVSKRCSVSAAIYNGLGPFGSGHIRKGAAPIVVVKMIRTVSRQKAARANSIQI